MPQPSFSFLIPTHREDRPLKRCLDSLSPQLESIDEVIVIGDTCDGNLPDVETLVQSYGPNFTYLGLNTGYHDYGHSQLNFGLTFATRAWLHINDDDDIWTPGAVRVMRSAATDHPGHPILFKFLSYHGIVYWLNEGEFAYERIGGHCLVAPNLPGRVGTWTARYQGDWDYVESAVNLLGGPEQIIWRPEIICVARPNQSVQFSNIQAISR